VLGLLIHLPSETQAFTGKFFSMDPEKSNRVWHAKLRRRDVVDIATGRRTREQVNRDNAWIANPQDWVPRNLLKATCAL
jgi:hypothetical protein